MLEDLTPDQRRAAVTHDRNLLVSAAAGSGKTKVLAERCAYLVADAEPPCNADELLVVTFTIASAEEMRRRIGATLSRRAVTSTDPRLVRQPMLLAGAQIGTIHGLCSSIIRRHFHEVGLDPNFRVLDDDESKLLRRDVADRLVERKLEGEGADVTVRLLEHYAGGSPSRIVNTLLALHARLGSLCDPDKWLGERRSRLQEAADLPVRQSQLGRAAIRIMLNDLDTLSATAERMVHTFSEANFPPYVQAARQLHETLAQWRTALHGRPFDQAADIVRSTEMNRLPPVKAGTLPERLKKQMDTFKKRVSEFPKAGLLLFTETQLQADVLQTLWAVDALDDLVTAFDESYTAAKRDTNALDFADLERFALKLLRDDATGQPTPIAEEYRRHFKHVLVDEYQDVNELQDTLLAMLAREDAGNLFCVGDVKQSIYRFRQADPARFKRRAARYEKGEGHGELIHMRMNFRSRGPLLDTLNGVFEALMTEQSAEVNYDESQRLVPGATFPNEPENFTGRPIELHLIEKKPASLTTNLEADEREAVLVAARINDLLGRTGKMPAVVTDRNGLTRPIDPGDFAVLLRAVHIKSERFAAILRRADLPVLADSTTGFFESTEVRDLLCGLRLIDNFRSEYDLAGHLRSPLCDWPYVEDKLATIRLAYPTAVTPWFHRAAARYAAEKDDELASALKAVFDRLNRWRNVAAESPVADLVWTVLEETSYLVWCAGLPDGEQRVANLMELHDRARAFDRFRRPTLSRFLHFLGTLEEQADLGMPSLGQTEQRAVRVMSIHKSKGLEYPVVVLPDLGKEFNLRDAGEMLLFDDAVGLGLRVVDLAREAHYPSLASTVAHHQIRRRALAEELRVLYVGATRAREHLILIGTDEAGIEESWDDAWRGHRGPMPPGDVLAARSMLDWVGPAAAQTEAHSPGSFERVPHTAEQIDELAKSTLETARRDDKPSLLTELQPLPQPGKPSKDAQHAIRRLQWQYPMDELTKLPAVTTVTDKTKRGKLAPGGESASREGVVSFEDVLRPPRCCRPDRTLSPVDRGSLTHTILQRLDFDNAGTIDDVKKQIGRLVERRFIRMDEADQADLDAVVWFAATDLGRQCREAGDGLHREFELVYASPVDGAKDPADLQMVRGRIDAVMIDDDGLTVIDYKTDRVTEKTIDGRVEFYRPQIDAYREQLQRVTGRPVRKACLVFTAVRRIVEV